MKNFKHHCRKWPPILRIMAKMLIGAPQDIHWALNKHRSRQLCAQWSIPSEPRPWLKLYKQSRSIYKLLFKTIFAGDEGTLQRLEIFWADIFHASRLPKSVIEEYFRSLTHDQLTMLYYRSQWFVQDIERRLDNCFIRNMSDGELPRHIKETLATPQVQFLLRVFAPCFTLYGIRPSELLYRL